MKKLLFSGLLLAVSSMALAKLPPLSDEAKAKAAEAAAKAAWSGKLEAYKLCKVQDKVAASYFKTAKDPKPPVPTPPCSDPGPFAYVPPEAAKPLEASGAHSPAATATSPPSSTAPAATIDPAKKP